ncbi:RNA-directed DNA polymerase, eukaryota, reverse transcriptase zinc-binding domain protein, partial [Tanacetum coccineum]
MIDHNTHGTWVFRGRQSHQDKSIPNPYTRDVERIAESFYITNFPDHINAKALWKYCEPYGKIVDAYIASKPSKVGKRFGFVRFLGVNNGDEFAKRLSKLWFVSFHLYAAVARFKRPIKSSKDMGNQKPVHSSSAMLKNQMPHIPKPLKKPVSGEKSYASVVYSDESKSHANPTPPVGYSVTLNESDLIQVEDVSKVALVKVREVATMNNIYSLYKTEGFTQIKVHYVGGLWLWIQFHTPESCIAFKNNSGSSAMKKIANLFGKFMFFEMDQDNNIGIGRICIATKKKTRISKLTKVNVNGETYDVSAHELGTWTIKIDNDDVSESETSDNEEEDKYSVSNDSFGDENIDKGDDKGDSGNEHVSETPLHDTHVNRDQGQKNDNSVHAKEQVNSKEDSLESSCPLGFEAFKTQKQNTPQRLVTYPIRKWSHSDDTFFMINIYGPQDPHVKVILWDKLKTFIRNNHGKFVLFGDLNEVRDDSERIGSYFSRSKAHVFNSFIDETDLVDLPIGGRRFTWINKAGSKLSKLDIFLVSQSVIEDNVHLKATVLERGWSDHNLILLHDRIDDYGPVPFKLFHSWFLRTGFHETVLQSINTSSSLENAA